MAENTSCWRAFSSRGENKSKKQWLDSEARDSTSEQAGIFNNEGD